MVNWAWLIVLFLIGNLTGFMIGLLAVIVSCRDARFRNYFQNTIDKASKIIDEHNTRNASE